MCDIDPQIVCSLYRHRPLCAFMCFCCICNKWSYFFTVESLHRLRPHFPYHLLRETVLHDLLYCWDTSPTGFHGGHWGLVGQRCEVQLQPDLLPVVSDPEKGPRNAPGCGEKQESGRTLSRRNWKRKVCCTFRDKRNLDWTAFRLKPFLHVKAVPNIVPWCAKIPRNGVKLDFFPCKNCSNPFGSWARFLFNYKCANKHCCKFHAPQKCG